MKYRLLAIGCLAGLILATFNLLQNSAPDPSDAARATMGIATHQSDDLDDNIWLVPRIILDGARSFTDWLMLPDHPATALGRLNRGRLRDFDGLFSPPMQQHWDSFAAHPDKHYLKNIGSEWVRLDPQRAYKTLSFCLVIFSLLLMLAGLALGIGIGLALHRRRGGTMPGGTMSGGPTSGRQMPSAKRFRLSSSA